MIDLHMHSTASDGTDTPQAVSYTHLAEKSLEYVEQQEQQEQQEAEAQQPQQPDENAGQEESAPAEDTSGSGESQPAPPAQEESAPAEDTSSDDSPSYTADPGSVEAFIAVAEAQLGKPYVLGGKGPNSFDCSGLIYYCPVSYTHLDVYKRQH